MIKCASTCLSILLFVASGPASAQLIGEGPALGPQALRTTQADVDAGTMSLHELRLAGLQIFASRFNQFDGFGDGPMNPADTTSPGGRPSLGRNGTFLRINGLDAQSCNECHGFVSTATVPPTLGVGGSGGINNVAMFMPQQVDVADDSFNGFASFDGRLILPPALFGAGGVQLIAKEMTAQLQALKAEALANPGTVFKLITKDVDFGVIVADSSGELDLSGVVGVDTDLIVRPFGRKGEFSSVRGFDQGAMMFHFGMQPAEVVGDGIDEDNDGVVNEILAGELSVLEIFITTQETPRRILAGPGSRRGKQIFQTVGCAECHRPELRSETRYLSYSFPEDPLDPAANVYYTVDLSKEPSAFALNRDGGLSVPLFGDLKRHNMGDDLSEDFQGADASANREFITAELWGVADTGPYLHDGRALTLNAAILAHGGEALPARDAYASLSDADKNDVLSFLHTLRTPSAPNTDVLNIGGERTENTE